MGKVSGGEQSHHRVSTGNGQRSVLGASHGKIEPVLAWYSEH